MKIVGLATRKGWRIIMAILLALSMVPLLFPVNHALAAHMPHQVTNVDDKSFTVSWVTSTDEEGYVNYDTSTESLDNTAYDDRGQATSDDTHHVTISGLRVSRKYYYEIVSGGVTYNNSGVPYEITTGLTLEVKMPEMITGTVHKADSVTAAEGTIVYATIGTSQVLSALVDENGNWAMIITEIRAADYQTYYTHSDSDDISLEANGSADGTASQTVSVATAKARAPDMTLAVAEPIDEKRTEETQREEKATDQTGDEGTEKKQQLSPSASPPRPSPPAALKPINWALVGGITGGVIAVAVFIFFLVRRGMY